LLKARVIIYSYDVHVRLLPPEPWSSTKVYSGRGGRHGYAIKWFSAKSTCPIGLQRMMLKAAKKIKKPIYVTSRTGLWMASPDGKVTQVFKSPTWFSDKKS
jgi:hypothetical protein